MSDATVSHLLGRRIRWTESGRAVGVRSGVVWSAGPRPGTAWVTPDHRRADEGLCACVTVRESGRHVATPVDQELSLARHQNLRRLGLASRETRTT